MPTTERSSKRTLLYGWTFDPVHRGHLHLLEMAGEHTDYERVILMVTRLSNFKQESRPASGEDRVRMLEIAIDEFRALHPEFPLEIIISTMELERKGVSYTYDTVCDIYREYPIEGRLGFLMGDDLLSSLDHWYRYDELKKLLTFVCFSREGGRTVEGIDADIRMIEAPILKASSTSVRSGDLSNLTDGVREYILKHGLYR